MLTDWHNASATHGIVAETTHIVCCQHYSSSGGGFLHHTSYRLRFPVNQYPFVMERRNTTDSILHISLLFFGLIKYNVPQ